MTSEDPETALVHELRTLAGKPDGHDFFVRHDGQEIRVSYTSGSSANVTLMARYDIVARKQPAPPGAPATYRDRPARRPLIATRPLAIELRRENAGDVAAKRSGLSAEWQSGDAAFDDAVYVSTPMTRAEILSAVLGPEVRRGVVELLDLGFSRVRIDEDGEVRAYLVEFVVPQTAAAVDRGAKALAAFARILSNLPAIEPSGEGVAAAPLAGWTLFFKIVGGAGWLLNVGYLGIVIAVCKALIPFARDPSAWAIVCALFLAVVGGLIGAKLYAGLVRTRVQGTSLAHARVSSASMSAFAGVSVITFTLLVIAIMVEGAKP